ncbi:hypothetical protein GJ496_000688 [Pomphorhynchus laevis]|nr:hypothetical protein GJ496_000688 [Pomphorhynchus laevis]
MLKLHPLITCIKRCYTTSTLRENLASIERIFMNPDVQNLLNRIAIVEYYKKDSTREPSTSTTAKQIQLMTVQQYEKFKEKMHHNSKTEKLQMPPILKDREHSVRVLEDNKLLKECSKHKMVFVDISLNVNDSERMVWFRDTDGKLCTSAYDDRRRWMQTFLNRRLRSSHIPVMFSEAHINNPLELQHYKYILERACLQFEPDDPEFVRVCLKVYFHINKQKHFESLRGTRFYGSMVFYLCWYKQIDNLLSYYLFKNECDQAHMLLTLFATIHRKEKTIGNNKHLEDMLKSYIENECNDKSIISEAFDAFLSSKSDKS